MRYYSLEAGDKKIIKVYEDILKDEDLFMVSKDTRAKLHLLVGLAKFIAQKVPYNEVKIHLKSALLEAEDDQLKSSIAYNLAIINYSEI